MRARHLFPGAVLALAVTLLIPVAAFAQTLTIDLPDLTGGDTGAGSITSQVIQIIALITILSVAPSILVMVTSFVRIVVVLSILRTAIGLQQSPPNAVIISLALFLTFFIMSPVLEQSYREGIAPVMAEEMTIEDGFAKAAAPVHGFMIRHVRDDDLRLFIDLAGIDMPAAAEVTPFHILVPAFMISELRRAFEIGFMIFLPFLIIDLVIASILMSMGMMMLPPVVISLPFKLIFFVLVDGWRLIAGSLVQSFGGG